LDKVLTENPPQSIHISPSGNVFEDSGTSLPLVFTGINKKTHTERQRPKIYLRPKEIPANTSERSEVTGSEWEE
jgi:hypothetical protein